MNRAAFLPLFVGLLAVACGVQKASSDSSSNDLSTSLDNERTCAAAEAYERAPIGAFDTPAESELPASLVTYTHPHDSGSDLRGDIARLRNVPGIGVVYAVQSRGSEVVLFDRNGVRLTTGRTEMNGKTVYWYALDGMPLPCGGTLGDDDDDDNSSPPITLCVHDGGLVTCPPASDGGGDAGAHDN